MRNDPLCQETCLLVVSHTINNSNASQDVSPSVKSPKVPQELGGLSFYETAGGVGFGEVVHFIWALKGELDLGKVSEMFKAKGMPWSEEEKVM